MSDFIIDREGKIYRVTSKELVTTAELLEEQERLRSDFKQIGELLNASGQPTNAAPANDSEVPPSTPPPEAPAPSAPDTTPAAPAAPADGTVQFPSTPAAPAAPDQPAAPSLG